jgi:peroxiredoxin
MSQGNKMPAPGERAPGFTLPLSEQRRMSLDEFRGRPVILVFYPADWSPVCSEQMALYQGMVPEFERHEAQLIGISVDSVWSHRAFAESRGINYPLLSDFEPKGEVSRLYGSYSETTGTAQRTLFLLDRDGVVAWSHRADPQERNPGGEGVLAALEVLSTERVAR